MMRTEQGALALFDHVETGGEMWTGSGRREISARAAFARPFSEPPAVLVAIRLIDGDSRSNLRLELAVTGCDPAGFTVTARTWSDTRIGRLSVSWLAVGERRAEDEEPWDL